MAKVMKIEVEGKEYILGFPTNKSAENAEILGFCLELIKKQPLIQMNKLFHSALLAKQDKITAEMARDIRMKFQEEGGDIGEINSFLVEQYTGFFVFPNGKKAKKKTEIIEV